MIRHKHLEKIGVKPVQQCFMSDSPTKQEKHRYKEYYKRYKKTGVFPSVTWSMDFSLLQWFYETTCEYLNLASEVVDLEYSKMTYNGQEYTQLELINLFKEKLKYVLIHEEDLFLTEEKNTRIQEIYDIWCVLSPAMWW